MAEVVTVVADGTTEVNTEILSTSTFNFYVIVGIFESKVTVCVCLSA